MKRGVPRLIGSVLLALTAVWATAPAGAGATANSKTEAHDFNPQELAQLSLHGVRLRSHYVLKESNSILNGEVMNNSAYRLVLVEIRVALTEPDSDTLAVDRRIYVAFKPPISSNASDLLNEAIDLPESALEKQDKRKFYVSIVSALGMTP